MCDRYTAAQLRRREIRNAGFSITSVETAPSAVKLLSRQRFDVVFCDLRLLIGEERTFHAALRKQPDLPIVALADGDTLPELQRLVAIRPVSLVLEPVDSGPVVSALKQAVSAPARAGDRTDSPPQNGTDSGRNRDSEDSILDRLPTGIMLFREGGILCYINETAASWLGEEYKDCLNRSLETCESGADLTALIANHGGQQERTGSSFCQTFGERLVEFTRFDLPDGDDAVRGVGVLVSDVTDLSRDTAARMHFVRTVTHELRAPLGAIVQYIDAILSGAAEGDPVRQQQMLDRCAERARAMLRLIDELSALSSATGAQPQRQLRYINIGSLLGESIEDFRAEAAARQVTVSLSVERDLPMLLTDPDDMRRVFANLLSNAIKFNRQGGTVAVSARLDGDQMLLSYKDSGYGIGEEAKQHIFTEFFRVRSPATEGIPGNGLGLPITKHLVERHGGSIDFDSELGVGTTFRVRLPLRREQGGIRSA